MDIHDPAEYHAWINALNKSRQHNKGKQDEVKCRRPTKRVKDKALELGRLDMCKNRKCHPNCDFPHSKYEALNWAIELENDRSAKRLDVMRPY